MFEMSPERGARNLLMNCAGAQPGARLLIAYEPTEFGYYDTEAAEVVRAVAQDMQLCVDWINVGFNPDNPHLSAELQARFAEADIILFLARLGDQLRFSDMPQGKTIIVSFALNKALLGSGFSNGHHGAFVALKDKVNAALACAQTIEISCPAGTRVSGSPEMVLSPQADTSIRRFPMSIFTPVPAHSFSGKVALAGFLTGTGSKYYDDYTIEFDAPLFAVMQEGRLSRFEGDPDHVARANAHYDRVAQLFDIDRDFVHSWHAGIHPGCGYPWDRRVNYEHWGGSAFGNPRILHFHTCGSYAPGEISWNVIDPTITVDGVALWETGTFRADRLEGGADILARFPCAAALFRTPDRAIGWDAAQLVSA